MGTAITYPAISLAKWGNSQGVRFPKDLCELVGAKVGSKAQVSVDPENAVVTLTFENERPKYHRARKVSLDELFEGWEPQPYEPPADWPTIGNEIDWEKPVGKETW